MITKRGAKVPPTLVVYVPAFVVKLLTPVFDVARRILIEGADYQVPVRIKIMLDAGGADLGMKFGAEIALAITHPLRVRCRGKLNLLPIRKPPRISLVGEFVIAVIQLEHSVLPRPEVDAEIAERPALTAFIHPTASGAVQRIQAITEHTVLVDGAAEIDVRGFYVVTVVGETHLVQIVLGRTLGDEIEHA